MNAKARRGASKAQFSGIESGGEGTSSANNHRRREKEPARAAQRAANQHVGCKVEELVSLTPSNTGLGVDPAKQKSRRCLLQQMHGKLQSLEQDMSLLKKIVVNLAEERSALTKEISWLFHSIEDCSVNSEAGATSFRHQPAINPRKDENRSRKMGLLEVLLQMERSSVLE